MRFCSSPPVAIAPSGFLIRIRDRAELEQGVRSPQLYPDLDAKAIKNAIQNSYFLLLLGVACWLEIDAKEYPAVKADSRQHE